MIQINIVGINALYSANLGGYFRKIYNDGNHLNGMSDEEKTQIIGFVENPNDAKSATLTSPGWIVELRGYTYHKAGANFVEHSIIENLKYPKLSTGRHLYRSHETPSGGGGRLPAYLQISIGE